MRTRSPRLPTPIALVVLAGCVLYFDAREDDRPPPPDNDGESARIVFERDVYPILAAKCTTCHATESPAAYGFVDPDPATAYDTVIASGVAGDFSPTTSPILAVVDLGHAPVAYTIDDRTKIASWLTRETEERQTAPPPPPFADPQVREWSGCMAYPDFLSTNMAAAWAGFPTQLGTCESCHASGTGGFLATGDPQQFFTALTQNRSVLLSFFAVDVSTGIANPQIVVNTDRLTAVATATGSYAEHPRFGLDSPAMAALRTFYELTRQRQAAGICEPPRLAD
jgi:hypothetical protein